MLRSLAFALCAFAVGAACSSASTPLSSREEARSYARGDVPCATDSDCCVVIDSCINQALVVRAADREKVASLVSEPDPMGCTGCLVPAVQVSCVSAQCAGTLIDTLAADAGIDPSVATALTSDHCGSVAGVPPQSVHASDLRVQAILGCGPQ